MNIKDLTAIFDRIATGRQTEADVDDLRQAITVTGGGNVVQVGGMNINVGDGSDLQLGDRHYYGADAEIIRRIIRQELGRDGEPGYTDEDVAAYLNAVIRTNESLDLRAAGGPVQRLPLECQIAPIGSQSFALEWVPL